MHSGARERAAGRADPRAGAGARADARPRWPTPRRRRRTAESRPHKGQKPPWRPLSCPRTEPIPRTKKREKNEERFLDRVFSEHRVLYQFEVTATGFVRTGSTALVGIGARRSATAVCCGANTAAWHAPTCLAAWQRVHPTRPVRKVRLACAHAESPTDNADRAVASGLCPPPPGRGVRRGVPGGPIRGPDRHAAPELRVRIRLPVSPAALLRRPLCVRRRVRCPELDSVHRQRPVRRSQRRWERHVCRRRRRELWPQLQQRRVRWGRRVPAEPLFCHLLQ